MNRKYLEEIFSSLAAIFNSQVEECDLARAEAASDTAAGKTIRQVLFSDTDGPPGPDEEAVFIHTLALTIGAYRRLVTSPQSSSEGRRFEHDRARGHLQALLELLPGMPHTQGSCAICGSACARPAAGDVSRHIEDMRSLLRTLDGLRQPSPCGVPPELALVWGAAEIVERFAPPHELRHLLRRQDGPLVHLARLAAWAAGDFGAYPDLTYEAQIRSVIRHRRAASGYPARRPAQVGGEQPFTVRIPRPDPVDLPSLAQMDGVPAVATPLSVAGLSVAGLAPEADAPPPAVH